MNLDELEALTASTYRAATVGRTTYDDVDRLRAAAHAATASGEGPGRDHAVRGAALLVVFKIGTRRPDLDDAIKHLEGAVEAESSPPRAANLAAALLERCDFDGDPADHRRALRLLRESLSDDAAPAASRVTRGTMLLGAAIDAVERNFGGSTLDEAIDLGERLVADADGLATSAEPENLLGCAYLLAAQRGHLRADLRRMVDLLEHAVQALQPDHPDRPARLSNLGSALLDRYEILGDAEDLRRATEMTWAAYQALADEHPAKHVALNNFVNAAVAGYERSGVVADVEAVLPLARRLAEAFPHGHPLHPVALANAGLVVRAASRALDAPDLIDEAIALHRRAVHTTAPDDPTRPGRMASLALALSDRYHRDQDPGDLGVAIELGEQSLLTSASHQVERVGFECNLANLYHDRYLRFGRMSDLVRAADLHDDGLGRLPNGHHDRAALYNNAGIVHHDLYDRLGDPAHLRQAASCLAEAVRSSDAHTPDYAARLANLASVTHRLCLIRNGDDDEIEAWLARAAALAEQAKELATEAAVRSVANGLLMDILRDTWRRKPDPALLERLTALDSPPAAGDRPAMHLRRGITSGLVGDRAAEERHLIAALDSAIDQRPAVAISAAQLLADLGLRRLAGGDRAGAALVERAAAAAGIARRRLVDLGEARRAELSWHREFVGLGALWAHARGLTGDLDGAWDAFDTTRAVLLRRYIPDAPPLDATYVAVWTTPYGGAAIIRRPCRPLQLVPLPALTLPESDRLAGRLANAALAGRRPLVPAIAEVGTYLSASMTGPLSEELAAGEPIVYCPGGPLSLLPIAVSDCGGERLVERHPLRMALNYPSACWSAAVAATMPFDPGDAFSIAAPRSEGLPEIPGAAWESERFAPADRQRHGPDATPAAVLNALRRASLVHIASHAGSGPLDPLAHHLVLAGGEPLFADTILDAAPLRTRLVVLAACGTAQTTIPNADEALTLSSVMHAAGVPTVIASLWSVADRPTARFMRDVADRLRSGGDPAAVLRQAQLAAIATGRPSIDWAAFVAMGG